MILIDANILLYAYDRDSPFYDTARDWLKQAMVKREELGFAWTTLLAFLRISAGGFTQGTLRQAAEVVEELTSQSNVLIVSPTAAHWPIFKKLLLASQVTRNMVPDAHLAALAIEHNAVLCTNDRDFSRFTGLKIINPVEKQ